MGAGQRAAGRQALRSSTCGEGESVTWRVPCATCERGGGSRWKWWMNEGGDAGGGNDDGVVKEVEDRGRTREQEYHREEPARPPPV